MIPAMNGDSAAGSSTLPNRLANLIASAHAATQVAPIRPPISACDELEGNAGHRLGQLYTRAWWGSNAHAERPSRRRTCCRAVVASRNGVVDPLASAVVTQRPRWGGSRSAPR